MFVIFYKTEGAGGFLCSGQAGNSAGVRDVIYNDGSTVVKKEGEKVTGREVR